MAARRLRFTEQMSRLFGVTKRPEGVDAVAELAREAERRFEDYSRLAQYEFKLSAEAETQFAVFISRLRQTRLKGVYTFSNDYPTQLRDIARKAYVAIEGGTPVQPEARQTLLKLLESSDLTKMSFQPYTRALTNEQPLDEFGDDILFVRVSGGSILGLADYVMGLSREVVRHRIRDRQFFRMVSQLPDGIKGPWLKTTFLSKQDVLDASSAESKAEDEVRATMLALPRQPGWEGRLEAVRSECRVKLREVMRQKWAKVQAAIDKYDADAFADMVRLDTFRTELQAFFAKTIPDFKFRLLPLVPLGPDGLPKWNAPPPLTLLDGFDASVPFVHLVKRAGVEGYDVVLADSAEPPKPVEVKPAQPADGKRNPFSG